MTLPGKIVAVGFFVGGVGFASAILGQRDLGSAIFLAGFYIAAIGIVYGMTSLPLPEEYERFRSSLRVGAVGFAIAAFAPIAGILTQKESLADIFVFVGAVVILGAVVLMCVAFIQPK